MTHGKIDFAPDFLKNLATGAGYDSNSAISELLDNSIGANAKEIRITVLNNKFKIEDKGEYAGMDEKTLKKNFFYGGKSSTRSNNEAAGKFGVGGKTGIMSVIGDMDADVEITTHKKGSKPIYANWHVTRGRCNTYDIELLEDNSIPYGTTIEFNCAKNVDIESLINFVSVVYCWAIDEGTKIYINNILVTPSDPLYRHNHNVIKHNLFYSKTFKVNGKNVTINITAFNNGSIIPEEELHSWDCAKGKTKTVCTANRSGIYVRTGGRYYTLGDNFNKIMDCTTHASVDGLRIEVCIPKSLWDVIGITWNKGKEITPFTKIECFNTGDSETGITDYIRSVMTNFKNDKETPASKKAKKILNVIKKTIDGYNVDVIASGVKNGKFVKFDNNTIIFDISQMPASDKQIIGTINGIITSINAIIQIGSEHMIANMITNIKL